MRTIRAAFNVFAAALELWATEVRTGVTLIEAVAIDERLTELRMIGDPAELLAIAVEAGKCGLTASEIEPMVRSWYLTQQMFRKLADQANRYADHLAMEEQA